MLNIKSLLACAAFTVASASSAQAFTTFFGEDLTPAATVPVGGNAATAQASFLSSLLGIGVETFDSLATGTAAGTVLSFPGSIGAITATLSGTGDIASTPGAGRFATSGSQFLQDVTNGFTLSFSAPVAAFGFFATDIGDFNGQITASLDGGTLLTIPNTINAPNGSLLFWGIVADDASETFSSLSFGNTAAGSDIFGFDDLVIGDLDQVAPAPTVPLPAGGVLLLAGLGALGALRRKA